jgi:hypothetical protein
MAKSVAVLIRGRQEIPLHRQTAHWRNAALTNQETLRNTRRVDRIEFLNRVNSRLCGSTMQPRAQFLHRRGFAAGNHLDGAVRQIAGRPTDSQSLSLQPRAMPKEYALNFPMDEKPAKHVFQDDRLSVGGSRAPRRAAQWHWRGRRRRGAWLP